MRRFGRPLLGQSGLIDGDVHDTHVTAATAHQLTLITLALLRDLRERWPEERLAVHIATELLDDRVRVQVRATAHGAALAITEPDGSAWWQWATARAAAASIPFRVNDGCVLLELRRST